MHPLPLQPLVKKVEGWKTSRLYNSFNSWIVQNSPIFIISALVLLAKGWPCMLLLSLSSVRSPRSFPSYIPPDVLPQVCNIHIFSSQVHYFTLFCFEPHAVAHLSNWSRSSCRVAISCCEDITLLGLVSTAKTEIEVFIPTSMSFMNTLNRIGTRINIWDIQLMIPDHSKDMLFITTLWPFSTNQFSIQVHTVL